MAELIVYTGLRFLFKKCRGKQESPPNFLLSNKGKGEKNRKRPFREFLSKGGRLWKGKVLASFPSVVFHGVLGTFSFFEIACVCVFEKL